MTYAEFFAKDLAYLYREREEERAKKWKTKVLQTEESYKVFDVSLLPIGFHIYFGEAPCF